MDIEVRLGDWQTLGPLALPVRYAVFVREQHVPEELELDEHDPPSLHAIALVGGETVGTGRLTPDGRIGRMAVLPGYRNRGVGARLLLALRDAALAQGLPRLELHAQVHAIPFYQRLGFVADGPVFDDAGIPHRRMHWNA